MPKAFLVKKAKRRLDLGEGESNTDATDSGDFSQHCSSTSIDDLLSVKHYEDTLRHLYNHRVDNTRITHGRDIPLSTREEIFDSSSRRSVTGERLMENWPFMPHRMLFFPPLVTQGNYFAERYVPISKLQSAPTSEDGPSLPRRESVLKVNPGRKTPDDVETPKTTSNDKIVPPWNHPDTTSSIWLPTSHGFHTPSKFTFPDRRINGERSEIYSFDHRPYEDIFDSLKRKRMDEEREMLSAKGFRPLGNSDITDIPNSKCRKYQRARSASPERVSNLIEYDQESKKRCFSYRETKFQKLEEETNSLEKDSMILQKRLKQDELSAVQSEEVKDGMESELDPNATSQRYHLDRRMSVPFLNIFNYHNPYPSRERRRSAPSTVWFPANSKTMGNEEATRVLNGSFEKDAWKPQMDRERNGLLHDTRERQVMLSPNEEDKERIESKFSSERHKAWLQDAPLSPKSIREEHRAANTVTDGKHRKLDHQRISLEQELSSEENPRNSSPDHSIIKTSRNSNGYENGRISEPFSPVDKRECGNSPFSPGSPDSVSRNLLVGDMKKDDLETLRLSKDAKRRAVEKPNGKVFSDHSTLWLLSKDNKTSQANARPELFATASSPPLWVTANGGFGVRPQISMPGNKCREEASKISPTTTHNHRCEICNSTFSLRRLLNRHLKTHSFYKRYTCSFCDKGFNDTFDLKRHVRTHTGIKPFKCEQCDKSFTQRCSLEAHQTRVHGMVHKFGFRERRAKMFVCEDCGATFKDNQTEFMNHMASAHPEKQKAPWAKKSSRLCSRVISF